MTKRHRRHSTAKNREVVEAFLATARRRVLSNAEW